MNRPHKMIGCKSFEVHKMKICNKCNKKFDDKENFCSECGKKLSFIKSNSIENDNGKKPYLKINYSLGGLSISLISLLLLGYFIVINMFKGVAYDNTIEFGARASSYLNLHIIFLTLVLALMVIHFVLRRTENYNYKGISKSIISIILVTIPIIILLSISFSSQMYMFNHCQINYEYRSDCDIDLCVKYGGFGFGDCRICKVVKCDIEPITFTEESIQEYEEVKYYVENE